MKQGFSPDSSLDSSPDPSLNSSFPGFRHDAIGIIDFGDVVYTYRLCELAITIAYAISNEKDKLSIGITLVV